MVCVPILSFFLDSWSSATHQRESRSYLPHAGHLLATIRNKSSSSVNSIFLSNVYHYTSSSLLSFPGRPASRPAAPKMFGCFFGCFFFSSPLFSWKAGGVECRVHCIRYGVGFVRRSPDVSRLRYFQSRKKWWWWPSFSWLRKIILRVPSSSLFIHSFDMKFEYCVVDCYYLIYGYAIIVIKSMVGLLIYLIGGVVSVFSTTPEPPVATGLVIGWFERQLAPPSASAAPGRSARRLVSNRFPAASRPLSGQSWSACH